MDVAGSVARMLTLDTNGDGQLTQDELTDTRLQPLVSRADANKDGTLTSAELTAFFSAEAAPPGTRPPAAPGGGFVIARPGEILPAGLQDRLQLTEQQRREVATLQEKVDQDLQRILTPEQRQQLEALRARGNPDGPGPRPSAH